MKVLIFNKKDMSYAEEVALGEFKNNLEGQIVEEVDVESAEGIAQAKNYDITAVPSVVVAADDGRYVESWNGELPMASSVKYFLGA